MIPSLEAAQHYTVPESSFPAPLPSGRTVDQAEGGDQQTASEEPEVWLLDLDESTHVELPSSE